MEQFSETYQKEQRDLHTSILVSLARINPSYVNLYDVWHVMDWNPEEVTSQEREYLEELYRTLKKAQSMWSKYVKKEIKNMHPKP